MFGLKTTSGSGQQYSSSPASLVSLVVTVGPSIHISTEHSVIEVPTHLTPQASVHFLLKEVSSRLQ